MITECYLGGGVISKGAGFAERGRADLVARLIESLGADVEEGDIDIVVLLADS